MTTLDHVIALAKKTKNRTGKDFVVYLDLEIGRDESDGYFYADTHTWGVEAFKYGKEITRI